MFIISLFLTATVTTAVVVNVNKECNHNYVASITEPTCTDDGYTTYTCSECDDEYIDDYVDAKHSFVEIEEKTPTCLQSGVSYGKYCNICGFVETQYERLPAVGHDYDISWQWNGYGSCLAILTCKNDSTHIMKINATITSEEKVASTCITNGTLEYTARINIAGKEYSNTIIGKADLKSHNYDEHITLPTCNSNGFTTFICECGDTYVSNYTSNLSHEYELDRWEWDNYDAAKAIFKCSNLGCDDTISIDSIITTEIVEESKCDQAGTIEYKASVFFNNVEYIDVKDKEIDVISHEYIETVVEPTCDSEGYTEHRCTCGDVYYTDFTSIIPHDYSISWLWDGNNCYAVLTCKNNTDHSEVLEADVATDITKEATCLDFGEMKLTASVELYDNVYSDIKLKTLSKISHNYISEVINPTCEDEGYTLYKCDYCNHTYKDLYVDPISHNYSPTWEWDNSFNAKLYLVCKNNYEHVVEPDVTITEEILSDSTCVTQGEKKYTAKAIYNEIEYIDEKIEKLDLGGHYLIEKYTSPTCVSDGYTTYLCGLCDYNYKFNIIPASDKYHKYENTTVEATCHSMGYTHHDCINCDYAYDDNYVDTLPHDYRNGITTIKPTCDDIGYTIYSCDACDYSYITNYVDPLGHTYNDVWEWNQNIPSLKLVCKNDESHIIYVSSNEITVTINQMSPTCYESGYIRYSARYTYDDVSYTNTLHLELEMLSHEMILNSQWADDFSTCLITYKCDCGYGVEELINSEVVKVAETCSLEGYITYTAVFIYEDKEFIFTEVEYIEPHTNDDCNIYVIKPTCISEGYTLHECKKCGETYNTDYVTPQGHDYVDIWYWNEVSIDAYLTLQCKNDPDHLVENLTGNIEVDETLPTCSSEGLISYYIEIEYEGITYSSSKDVVLAQLDHEYNIVTTYPTCESDGYTTYTCILCGEAYTDNYIDKLGHDYEANCTWLENGTANITLVCNNDNTHLIAVGTTVTSEVITSPTCQKAGLRTYYATASYNGVTYECTKDEILPIIDHSYSETTVQPTCTAAGYIKYTCGMCSNSYQVQNASALGHDYQLLKTYDPTCYSEGYSIYRCSRCGSQNTTDYTDKIDHTLSYVSTTERTCTTDGYDLYVCDVCDEEEQLNVLEKLGHALDFGICTRELSTGVCDHIEPASFNNTYGYEYLLQKEKADSMRTLYRMMDAVHLNIHENYDKDFISSKYSGILNFANLGLTKDEAGYVWKMYRLDHPLYYWNYYGYSYTTTSIYTVVHNEFILGETREEYDTLLKEFIRQYVKTLPEDESIYMKALYFNDLIAELIDYKYDSSGEPDGSGYAHSIAGILDLTGVVCEGYAMMLNLLLNIVGIENVYAVGSNHAFNMIKLDDGNWYWIDTTWNDAPGWESGIKYNYFIVNDTQNIGVRDYTWYGTNTFMNGHEPYSPDNISISGSYLLPERSSVVYSSDELILRDKFTTGGFTYSIYGYNKVMMCGTTLSGDVVIPETVTYDGRTYDVVAIGGTSGKFHYASAVISNGVTSVTIPASITYIADNAFNCYSLQSINVSEFNEKYESLDGVLYTKGRFTLIKYPASKNETVHTIDENVVDVAKNAFTSAKYLETIVVTNNVTNIGTYSYGYNFRSTNSGTIRCYRYEIAYNMTKLFDVVILDGNTYFVEVDDVIYSLNKTILYACDVNDSAADVKILDSVVTINEYAFYGVKANTIILPTSITTIKSYAFYNVSSSTKLLYADTQADYNSVYKHSNTYITNLTIYYYSAEYVEGNYWYYDEDGNYVLW